MAEFKQQIKTAMELRNIQQAELCEKTGIPKSAMSQYISGAFKPKQTRLYLIAKALDVSEAWLMGFDVPMKREATEPSNVAAVYANNIYNIPVYESASAGFGAYACSDVIDYMPLYISNPAEAPDTIAINVKGDSMYPKIENGDVIVVHKQDSVDSGSLAVVLLDGEEALVKKVEYGKTWIDLVSINPEYQTRHFENEEVLRLKVVGLVKKIVKTV